MPSNYSTIHLRLYSDGSQQNLDNKHSQVGNIVGIADNNDNFNLVHWNSSRATRRAHSTEEFELMAFDIALRFLENFRNISFQLIKKKVPIVVYIDCDTLWKNLRRKSL